MSHARTCAGADRMVVGVDDSDHSRAALEWALAEAALRGTCLHVVHSQAADACEQPEVAAVDALVREALTATHLPQSFSARDHVLVESVAADPVATLVAASHDAALLVVGTHPHETFLGVGNPSVSQRAAGSATCPVAVVRRGHLGTPPLYHRVVVGVDDSFSSRDALEWAAAEARHRGCDVVMVHVPEAQERHRREHRHGWEDRVSAELFRQLRTEVLIGPLSTVPVVECVGMGYVSSALIRNAEDSSLLVLGSRGYGRRRDVLHGSVARDCLSAGPCPIVIVPNAQEDEDPQVRRAAAALAQQRDRSEAQQARS